MQDFLNLLVNLIKDVSVIMVLAYVLSRTQLFSAILNRNLDPGQKFAITLVFGLFAIFGTLGGVQLPGGIANVRDLGPAIAGFLAGPIVGLGAGLIGAIHRFSMGGPTAIGCSLSTIVAGLAAGMVWIYRRGNFPGVILAAIYMVLLELFHIGLNLLLGWSNPVVVQLLREVSLPMIVVNGVGMAIFAVILNNLIQERKTAAQKELIEGELKVARTIQMSLIPKTFPAFPEREEFDLFALLEPAREVGGDLYDFFLTLDDRLYFTVGDVSGKGVPASLFMAVTRTLLRARSMEYLHPDEILKSVNIELCRDNDSGMFVTQFLGVMNLNTGEIFYSNAGHNLPFIIRSSGQVEVLPRLPGMGMGVIEEADYQRGSCFLDYGDCLLVYTDGVTEAVNPNFELFGEARLFEVLNDNVGQNPRVICQQILKAVNEYAAGAEQADDITILGLTYTAQNPYFQINLDGELSELGKLARGLEQFSEAHNLPSKLVFQINLALDELVTNAITHASDGRGNHHIVIGCRITGDIITVKMEDDGAYFNPLTRPEPDVDLDIDSRPVGGLGIHLVRKLMDTVEYRREGYLNILTMSKKIDNPVDIAGTN